MVESTERPARGVRRYPTEFKRRIVEETLAPAASVAAVSRQCDVNANLIFVWRKQYHRGELPAKSGFIPIGVVDARGHAVPAMAVGTGATDHVMPSQRPKTIASTRLLEVEFRSGIKLRFDAGIATETLRRVVGAIKNCS